MSVIIPAPSGYYSVAVWLDTEEEDAAPDSDYLHDPIIAFVIDHELSSVGYLEDLVPIEAPIRPITATGNGPYPNDRGTVYVIKCPDGIYRRGEDTYPNLASVRANMRRSKLIEPEAA